MGNDNKALTILQIVKGLDIGNLHGGAERFAVDLSIALRRKGVDVIFCSFFKTNSENEKQWKQKIESHDIPCYLLTDWMGDKNIRNYFVGMRELEKIIKKAPVEISHSHFQLGTYSALLLKAKGLSKSALRTSHVTKEWQPGLYGWIGEHVFSMWLFPLFLDCEVGVSNEITNKLVDNPGSKLFRRKPICIHNAIPVNFLTQNRRNDLPQKVSGKRIIATIGRLSEEKGQKFFLESIKLLSDLKNEIEVWIVGDGVIKNELIEMVDNYGLNTMVKFLGQRNDIWSVLQQLDLVVVPSMREGFPTIVLESYNCGVPVLGTDVSGISEVVIRNNSGWLVPFGDVQELAKTILIALSDEKLRVKYVENGRKIAEKYVIDKIAEQYLILYQDIIKDKNLP